MTVQGHEHVLGVTGQVHHLDFLGRDVTRQEAEGQVGEECSRTLIQGRQPHIVTDAIDELKVVVAEHGGEVGGTCHQHGHHVVHPVVACRTDTENG